MDETYRIAAASSDGIVINQHFGRAGSFYIYEVAQGNVSLIEKREIEPVCQGGNHSDEKLRENIEELQDCRYLFVSRIGECASNLALGYGIRALEFPGEMQETVEKFIKYREKFFI